VSAFGGSRRADSEARGWKMRQRISIRMKQVDRVPSAVVEAAKKAFVLRVQSTPGPSDEVAVANDGRRLRSGR